MHPRHLPGVSQESKLIEELKSLRLTHAAIERQIALLNTQHAPHHNKHSSLEPLLHHPPPPSVIHNYAITTSPPVLSSRSNALAPVVKKHNHIHDGTQQQPFYDPNLFGNNTLVAGGGCKPVRPSPNDADGTGTGMGDRAFTKWESDRNADALANMRENIEDLFASGKDGFSHHNVVVKNKNLNATKPLSLPSAETMSVVSSYVSTGSKPSSLVEASGVHPLPRQTCRRQRVPEPTPRPARAVGRAKVF